jgi:uncharacterized protein YraI
LALGAVAILSLALGIPAAADLESGGQAVVAYTNGDGLNLRAEPSTEAPVIGGMPEGAVVEVLATGIIDDAGMAWAQISYAGMVGYSAAAFLVEASGATEPPPDDPQEDVPDGGGGLATGAWAVVSGTAGDGLNVRAAPSTDAAVVAGITEGTLALLLEGPQIDAAGNPWYQVDTAGVVGWVHGGYLVAAGPAPDDGPPADVPDPDDDPAEVGDEVGAAIVAEALNYLGVGYAWAGITPAGFDCSGFTYFVINQVLHNNFPRSIFDQVVSGEFVNREELQPGDLVFFENTYTWGLSHVGIYVGDNQFINAGSEWDNVAISDLTNDYWVTRYVTARRVR